ncbi:ferritin-like domain-containing protein [Streptomyces sp. TRM 70361]|uniref:ferritin-like domain-containing protein n=1 Tax=Streptomyces sp. TRM 70361 TaxID=3116553 RepID=UPI002E7BF65F|nr:ferritin-like domain-containing protein [Streptomyces sp. TRM 70361]MEE1942805.1 ferritin-like domain-containing protein [Streptomyces sp. TRM 70361]
MRWTAGLFEGLYEEALRNDAAFALLCSLTAAAEARNGRENRRIAVLVPRGQRDLAPGLAGHGEQQGRHARLLAGLPATRGLSPVEVPPETDHARSLDLLLERRGGCPAHGRLRRGEPLKERDVIAHLAHGYVAETRAAAWLARLAGHCAGRLELARPLAEVLRAKGAHLEHCRQGLLRFVRAGHGAAVRWLLRENALAESRVHRDTGLAVLARLGGLLDWSMTRSVALETWTKGRYAYERLTGVRDAWCRLPSGGLPVAVVPSPPPSRPAAVLPGTPPAVPPADRAPTASPGV